VTVVGDGLFPYVISCDVNQSTEASAIKET
jgi:hypothetical protein